MNKYNAAAAHRGLAQGNLEEEEMNTEYPMRHSVSVLITEGCKPGKIGTEVEIEEFAEVWVTDTFDVSCGKLKVNANAHIHIRPNAQMIVADAILLSDEQKPHKPIVSIESGGALVFKPDSKVVFDTDDNYANVKDAPRNPFKEFFIGQDATHKDYFCSNTLV